MLSDLNTRRVSVVAELEEMQHRIGVAAAERPIGLRDSVPLGATLTMKAGSAARYGHDKADRTRKVAAEGIEALKEVSGYVDDVLANLLGGVQSGMGYLGAATLDDLRQRAQFVRVSDAGVRESHVHDVMITREAPNYQGQV